MSSSTWLEVSLVVDGEMAEAVAEILARFAPGGVAIESTAIAPDTQGEGYPTRDLRVCAYLPADEALEATRRQLEEALWYLGRIRTLPEPVFRQVQEMDWAEAWKQHYHPIPIGRRLLILPAWLEAQPADRVVVRMDPGMAFGTGTHPTTQLCLETIEEILVSAGSLDTMIDLGCGSGILAVAALELGVERALGVDIDPLAVRMARQNAELNRVGGQLEVSQGSLAEILAGAYAIQEAPLVVANILAPVIIRLFEDGLERLVSPGGVLILSGILETQAEEVEAAARAHGFGSIARNLSGDWAILIARR